MLICVTRIELLTPKENALKSNQPDVNALLIAVFRTAVDSIIIIDRQGIIKMVNLATERLFGYEIKEMLNQNVKMLMPEPDHSAHDGYLSNYLSTGKAKIIGIGREVTARKKDGTLFPISLGVSKVESDGEILFTGVIHDLTRRKQDETKILKLNEELEQRVEERTKKLSEVVNKLLKEVSERELAEAALKESQEELEALLEQEKGLNELKSRFVSMASHEFRTPLSTILSSAAIIGRYTESDQQDRRDKHIQRIKSSVANLNGILNDLLSLSKLEEGKVELKMETFEWLEFCENLGNEMTGMIKPGQEIIHKGPSEPVIVKLDKHHLKNVLINLLSNAIKYSPEGKDIYCITQFESDTLKIEVKDEGIGIPQIDQKHLFDRFFRAQNVTNIQGTGLGLNITKRYLDLMEGSISFKSEEGKGTSFFVEIPLKT